MNNEEKALEIQHNDPCCVWNNGCPNVRNGAMKMAQWKDEQFKKFLREICFVSEKFINEKFDKINEL